MRKYRYTRKKHNYIIYILLFLICCLSLGYAIYGERLNVNGILAGSTNFRVYFIEAWVEDSSKGIATINKSEGADKVTFDVTLDYPGDKCLVGTKIKNESSMAVKLNDFGVSGIDPDSDIKFDYIELNSENEILQAGEICDYEFTIAWDQSGTTPDIGNVNFQITLQYEQYTETPEVKKSHNHGEGEVYTAFFDANGGEIAKTSKMITFGSTYGDLPIPKKTEYTFLGWYTALENGEQITADNVVNNEGNITLYAVWSWDGHSYGDYEITTQALCLDDGEEKAVCSVCGESITRPIQALGHSWGSYTTTKAATCTTTGTKQRNCLRIGCTASETATIAALGHSWSAYTTTKAATCTATGTKKRTCQRAGCTASETATIAKKSHTYVSGWCYAQNVSAAVCSSCKRCVQCGSTNTRTY